MKNASLARHCVTTVITEVLGVRTTAMAFKELHLILFFCLKMMISLFITEVASILSSIGYIKCVVDFVIC